MKKYDSYKDSGITWIGDVPDHWVLNKVGNTTYVKGRIGWKGLRSEDFIDEGTYLITGTDFNSNGTIKWENMYHVCQERYDEDPFIQLKDHDILITKDGTIGKVVYVGELKGQTCLNSGIFLTRPLKNDYLPKYFFWVLNSSVFTVFVDYNSGGSTIQHLYQNVFVNFKFPIPPLPEQTKIVQYLDTKTTQIDTLIQKTQEKIKLLREKRTSLINHTLTKGLNPDVEMKDSGVEWIGKIPGHWKICKLKYISELITDGSHFSPEIQDEGRFYISVSDITKENSINFEDCKRINNKSFDELEKNGCRPEKGDILLTKDGTIGRGTIVDDFNDFVILSSLGLIRLKKEHFNKFFLCYLLSGLNIDQMYSHIRGSGITRLTIKLINDLLVIVPDFLEQVQIVDYLNDLSKKIDTLVQKEEKRIELLKEYRQSLISNVVTGKIKVTDHE